MIKFLMGIIVGVLICFVFLYFGGGKLVKTMGEGLTDTGKKMEVMEDIVKKEAGTAKKAEKETNKIIVKEKQNPGKPISQ